METNNEADDSIPDVAELPTVKDGEQDTTDWKATAQSAQEALKKATGIAKRFQTKLSKLADPKSAPAPAAANQPAAVQPKGFDYAQKAYLKSSGINNDEFDFVKEVMDATGKTDIDAVLGSKYFQAELKERRDVKATEAATPSGTKRAGNSAKDQVDYWIAKGELPPSDQRELRQKVVNAKIAAQTSKSQFANQSVIDGVNVK